jgi:hypothetical protein
MIFPFKNHLATVFYSVPLLIFFLKWQKPTSSLGSGHHFYKGHCKANRHLMDTSPKSTRNATTVSVPYLLYLNHSSIVIFEDWLYGWMVGDRCQVLGNCRSIPAHLCYTTNLAIHRLNYFREKIFSFQFNIFIFQSLSKGF